METALLGPCYFPVPSRWEPLAGDCQALVWSTEVWSPALLVTVGTIPILGYGKGRQAFAASPHYGAIEKEGDES